MTDRETLAARIEAATGPDRELDVEIGVLRREVEWRDGFLMKLHPQMGSTDDICHNPRAYTASVDAAMMLTGASMDADDIATLFAQAVRACKAAKCDWRKHLPRFLAAEAIRSQP